MFGWCTYQFSTFFLNGDSNQVTTSQKLPDYVRTQIGIPTGHTDQLPLSCIQTAAESIAHTLSLLFLLEWWQQQRFWQHHFFPAILHYHLSVSLSLSLSVSLNVYINRGSCMCETHGRWRTVGGYHGAVILFLYLRVRSWKIILLIFLFVLIKSL